MFCEASSGKSYLADGQDRFRFIERLLPLSYGTKFQGATLKQHRVYAAGLNANSVAKNNSAIV